MAHDQPVKALVIALTDHAAAAVYSINRLQPDSLCFVLPEAAKSLVESEVQPKIEHMPRRWDWVVIAETGEFVGCYQTLARTLPEMLRTWDVQSGELVVDVTGATPAMAGALTLVTMPMSSRIVSLVPAQEGQEGDRIDIAGQPFVWTQGNPWDEAASVSRREGCELFNRRLFAAAAKLFREIEARVSGGQKPLYRAFADLADGYDLWERFHYRQAWEKLKTAVKAFEMASLWGGPPGLTSLLPAIKANAGFLEKLVLDPAPVKDMQAPDLLAHAGRRLHGLHDPEAAMVSLVRALEAFAQRQLFKQYTDQDLGRAAGAIAAGATRNLSILLAGRSRRQVQIAVAGAVPGAGRIGRPDGPSLFARVADDETAARRRQPCCPRPRLRAGQSRAGAAAVRSCRQAIGRQRDGTTEVSDAEPLEHVLMA